MKVSKKLQGAFKQENYRLNHNKRDNSCFSGNFQTGKLFWDVPYAQEKCFLMNYVTNENESLEMVIKQNLSVNFGVFLVYQS